MIDPAAARARGRAKSSRSRTQGEAFGGAKGEPEDADPAPISRVIRVRGVVESAIYGPEGGAAPPPPPPPLGGTGTGWGVPPGAPPPAPLGGTGPCCGAPVCGAPPPVTGGAPLAGAVLVFGFGAFLHCWTM